MQFYKAFYTFAFHQSSAHWSESTGLLKLLSPTWGQTGAKKEGDMERQTENQEEKKKEIHPADTVVLRIVSKMNVFGIVRFFFVFYDTKVLSASPFK